MIASLAELGYRQVGWTLLLASDYGVPQLRPRSVLVAIHETVSASFAWPIRVDEIATVGDTLLPLVSANGWPGAEPWAAQAKTVAPTIVGGSHKHGGPDLGPTRARERWLTLGVDGRGLADSAPQCDHPKGAPFRLTLEMTARLQGFPIEWQFSGGKTAAYRQIGNAFPPPVAAAVGTSIAASLRGAAVAHGEPLAAQPALPLTA